jgi:hypothetical protein
VSAERAEEATARAAAPQPVRSPHQAGLQT